MKLNLIKKHYHNFLKNNAIWFYNNKKTNFYFKNDDIKLIGYINNNKYIEEKDWGSLNTFLLKDEKTNLEDLFIANSLIYIQDSNFRVAILEVVIALEYFFKSNGYNNIKHFLTEDNFNHIKNIFKSSFSYGIEYFSIHNNIKDIDINFLLIKDLIRERNNIMHNGKNDLANINSEKMVINAINLIYILRK
ncbi:MAG: hypothetical protein Q9M97_06515 [Candidatus Gracilibacteria bacterium]|nr:hypothetical protein [Candidatus Gracilibacteria bacterium]